MIKRSALATAAFALLVAAPASPAAAADCDVVSGLLNRCAPAPSSPPPSQSQPSQPPPQEQPQQPQEQPQPEAGDFPAGAARLLELVNEERAHAGLRRIEGRGDIADIAAAHSRDMAARREIWHNDAYFTPSTRQRLRARGLGENVAMNTTVEGAHRALMNSAGHRANILNPDFTVAGFAIARDERGVLYATQNFIVPDGSPGGGNTAVAGAPARCRKGFRARLLGGSCAKGGKVKAKGKARAKVVRGAARARRR